MKTVTTALGNVEVLNASIVRKSGYGQYSIIVEIEFESEKKTLNIHSTDSQLFDAAQGEDNHSEIVLTQARYTIENAIEDYISGL